MSLFSSLLIFNYSPKPSSPKNENLRNYSGPQYLGIPPYQVHR